MKLKKFRDGKWELDVENNKLWTNTCNTCCLECEFECEQHCEKIFKNSRCMVCDVK